MNLLHALCIFLEIVIFVLALKMVFEKKRYIGICWAVTYGLYVFYDVERGLNWGLPREFMDTVFLIATLSALFAVWHLASKRG
jgi:hypothetical protein